jgi:hypothetical protein
MDYISFQPQWEKYSAIRTRPRRFLSDEENPGYAYPPIRQPILVHPKLKNIDERTKRYILAQSLFKYMNDIACIETDLINKAAYGIFKNQYKEPFPFALRRDALTIIIDESYHAYVALDYMEQVAVYEKIEILELPYETELSRAIRLLSKNLTPHLCKQFELISVCMAEHALTNDLMDKAKSKDVCKTFFYVMHDHILDETRHANYFERILKHFWMALSEEEQNSLAPLFPKLINLYSGENIQKEFDKKILLAIDIKERNIEDILNDTHCHWSSNNIDKDNIVSKQMIQLLQRVDIFDHPMVAESFRHFGIQ